MAETANLELPLLAAGQAQKHVTVNEALSKLDWLVQLSLKSRTLATPPGSPSEGDRYAVAPGATGAWSGQSQKIAIFLNGGWEFVQPLTGWRAFVEDEGAESVFAYGMWTTLTLPAAMAGAIEIIEIDHVISAGGAQTTSGQIPSKSVVLGVTARVKELITGATGWSLGINEAETRYGEDLPTGVGVQVKSGLTGPMAYRTNVPLKISPVGGNFTGGRITLHVYRVELSAPPA